MNRLPIGAGTHKDNASDDHHAGQHVLLIDQDGVKVGVVSRKTALEKAQTVSLDLVDIAPAADPPVCKIMDLGKHKYQQQKKRAEARKKQKTVDVKEIKMRPNIDQHDYDVKMRAIRRFLDEGNKVRVSMRFRGREITHQDRGLTLFERVVQEIKDVGKVEMSARIEGRQALMILTPR